MEMFGKKVTYFEDGGGSTAAMEEQSTTRMTKVAGKQQRPMPPARCQVEGCRADLTGVKMYYFRHKVCAMHSKSPRVIVDGMEQRFCQQCSRFHQLHEFDQGKRSCRRRLAGHNERRRKPPPPPLSTRFSPFQSHPETSNRFRGYFMDFPYPGPSGGTSKETWTNPRANGVLDQLGGYNHWHGCLDTLPVAPPPDALHPPTHGVGILSYMQGRPQFSSPPVSECLEEDLDSSCALSLLSMQPTQGTPTQCQGSAMTTGIISFDGAPLAHLLPTNYSSSGGGGAYDLIGHGVGGCSHRMQGSSSEEEVSVGSGGNHFSGELELALQGGRGERTIAAVAARHGSGRGYDRNHGGHGFNWPL